MRRRERSPRPAGWALGPVALILVLLVSLLGACESEPTSAAARVNGRIITPGQVDVVESVSGIGGSPVGRNEALEQAIRTELVRQEAEKRTVVVSEEDVAARVAEVARQVGGQDVLAAKLTEAGLTQEQFATSIKDVLLGDRLAAAMLPEVKVKAAAIRVFYRTNAVAFTRPAAYDLGAIQVKNEMLGRAIARDLKRGKDFEDLAGRVTMDPIARKDGGRLGWVLAASVPEELAPLVARLKVGEWTDPVASSGGWFILKLFGVRAMRTKPLASVRSEISAELVRRGQARALKRWLDQARSEAAVEILQ